MILLLIITTSKACNGTETADTFRKMQTMEPAELEAWREHHLKYCGLDTYAMVKVWQKLVEMVQYSEVY